MPAIVGCLAFAAMVLAGLVGTRFIDKSQATLRRVSALLCSAWATWAAGLVSGALVVFVWGSLREPPVVHDEQAYLLQARIFASGHWTAPSPRLPELFEQMHVFVQPAVFAKYPPGHAPILVPGIWFGLPGLMPVLLTVVAGALVYWLMRHYSDEWTALLGWLLWSTAGANLYWRASYFSELSSSATWLIALWATTRWLVTNRRRFLIATTSAIAICALARPVTAVALAVPLVVVVVRHLSHDRLWRQALPALAAAVVLIGVWPLWNYETLRDPLADPYAEYSRRYFPFDRMGFGFDSTPPLLAVPPELAWVGARNASSHRDYRPAGLPFVLVQRLVFTFMSERAWRLLILSLFFIGLKHLGPAEHFGLASMGSVFLCYLLFAHAPSWSVYYLEILPAFYFVAARGARVILRAPLSVVARRGRLHDSPTGPEALAILALCGLWLPFVAWDVANSRLMIDSHSDFHRRVEMVLGSIGGQRAVVFVEYPAGHNYHQMVAPNNLDPNLWIVPDRGSDNMRLTALDPDRSVFRLHLKDFTLESVPVVGRRAFPRQE